MQRQAIPPPPSKQAPPVPVAIVAQQQQQQHSVPALLQNVNESVKRQKKYFYVLTDIMLCCTREQSMLLVNFDVPLVLPTGEIPIVRILNYSTYFQVITDAYCITLKAKTLYERDNWVSVLASTVNKPALVSKKIKKVPSNVPVPKVIVEEGVVTIQAAIMGKLARSKKNASASTVLVEQAEVAAAVQVAEEKSQVVQEEEKAPIQQVQIDDKQQQDANHSKTTAVQSQKTWLDEISNKYGGSKFGSAIANSKGEESQNSSAKIEQISGSGVGIDMSIVAHLESRLADIEGRLQSQIQQDASLKKEAVEPEQQQEVPPAAVVVPVAVEVAPVAPIEEVIAAPQAIEQVAAPVIASAIVEETENRVEKVEQTAEIPIVIEATVAVAVEAEQSLNF